MKHIIALVAAAAAVPAFAQPVAAPASAAPLGAPVDPARLALARTTIDAVWPLGTYARMMNGTMDAMMDNIMQSMFDMKLRDMVPTAAAGAKPLDPKLADATFRQTMAKADPNFQERMRIMNHVMMSEIVPLMSRHEPEIREGMAHAYARKFTAAQLADMNRFFATPSGRFYASESMLTMMDPEIMRTIGSIMPDMMRSMPEIMKKVQAATAHLPPVRPVAIKAPARP
jgi:hypothetical protein